MNDPLNDAATAIQKAREERDRIVAQRDKLISENFDLQTANGDLRAEVAHMKRYVVAQTHNDERRDHQVTKERLAYAISACQTSVLKMNESLQRMTADRDDWKAAAGRVLELEDRVAELERELVAARRENTRLAEQITALTSTSGSTT